MVIINYIDAILHVVKNNEALVSMGVTVQRNTHALFLEYQSCAPETFPSPQDIEMRIGESSGFTEITTNYIFACAEQIRGKMENNQSP